MEQFAGVTVIKQANLYFGGQVASRTVIFPNGEKKTLGIMQPGEYTFNTGVPEIMEILSGSLEVQLPGSAAWVPITGGQSFSVAGNAAFTMRVHEVTDYCCSFITE
jgi:uncharacterized protein YaiE (UPF0345 family)